jgi:hypothetical protein
MLANIDSNIWGLLVVPVGVALGFGPVIVAWLWASADRTEKNRTSGRHNQDSEE